MPAAAVRASVEAEAGTGAWVPGCGMQGWVHTQWENHHQGCVWGGEGVAMGSDVLSPWGRLAHSQVGRDGPRKGQQGLEAALGVEASCIRGSGRCHRRVCPPTVQGRG